MKRSQPTFLGAVVLTMLALAAVPAAAQTFAAGDDAFNTVGSGSTTVDISQFPGALSALGSPIVGGNVINLNGVSLSSSMGPSVDSIVARGAISSGSGSLTLAALNMASASNLVLQDGRQYSLAVCLSDTAPSNGTITLTSTSGDGGTFNSSFNVIPKLVFTNVNNHNDVIRIDCAVAKCNLNISSTNSGYVQTGGPNNFSPSAEGINVLPTGNQTVANCDGTHSVNISAPGGFYPGWTFSSGGSRANPFRVSVVVDASRPRPASSGGTFKPVGLNDNHAGAIHGTKPPQDCLKVGFQPLDAGRAAPQAIARYCATAQ
ncbi:MAG: hypothetical protein JOZ15_16525 [Acidobacteria bacterium]|nr:hypothetical protein [Acidobacteriota bacterium]